MLASSNPTEAKIILFIPFSFSEDNRELYNIAIEWQNNAKLGGKKIPEIVIYRAQNESGSEYGTPIGNEFSPEIAPPGTTIFMLAHGVGDPRWVANKAQQTPDTMQLPIELAAERVKQMGLTHEIATMLESFRLYTCEETLSTRTTRSLTINFAHALGTTYQFLLLTYYGARVFGARATATDPHVRKRAMLAMHYNAIMWAARHPVYKHVSLDKESIDKHFLLRASKFKEVLVVNEALEEKPTPLDEITKLCLNTNTTIDQKGLVQFSLFASLMQTAHILRQQPETDQEERNTLN